MAYDKLFTPGKIGKLEISNRIVMTPMEIGLAKFSGSASKEVIQYYYERAKGGVGLIINGITRVDNLTGVATPRQLALSSNSNIRGLKPLTKKIHTTDTKIFAQIHHPGRQNFAALMYNWPLMKGMAAITPGFGKLFGPLVKFYNGLLDKVWAPSVVAPSAVPCRHLKQKTRALKRFEIKRIIKKFIKAAVRAKKAGYDGVEIHASHGYLIQQFLSPRTNKRTDEYGGSFENRYRFLKEILEGVKQACGQDYPVIVRLTVEEYYTDAEGEDRGIVLEEGLKFAKAVEQSGADAIDVSSATYETMNKWLEPVTYAPGWRKNLAAEVKKVVSIPVIAANLVRSPKQAEEQLQEGVQDFIGIGRPTIADPYWAVKAKNGEDLLINNCINCLNCFESLNRNAWVAKPLECAVNPLFGHESDMDHFSQEGKGQKAVVVGGGVAGLWSAIVLAKRGFEVTLIEKEKSIGGQVNLAAAPPNKERIHQVIDDLLYKLKQLNVEIVTGVNANAEVVAKYNPKKVVLAAGSVPFMPPIPGRELPHVYSVNDILMEGVALTGKKVVVAGSGLTGLETAEFLAAKGNEVTVIEMMDRIGPTAYHQNLHDVLEHLEYFHTKFITSVRLEKINEKSIIIKEMKSGEEREVEAEAVVLSIGNRKNDGLFEEMKKICDEVCLAGDSARLGKIADAVKSGYEAAIG